MNLKEEIKSRNINTGTDLIKTVNRDILLELEVTYPFYSEIKRFRKVMFLKFVSEDISRLPPCPICGNDIKNTNKGDFAATCSTECSRVKAKSERKRTTKERYGVEHYSQTDEWDEKVSTTCMERYGVSRYTQTDQYLEQAKKTCLDKYGAEYYTQSEEFFNTANSSKLSEPVLRMLNDVDFIEKTYNKIGGVELSKIVGVHPQTIYVYLRKHEIDVNTQTSYLENDVVEFIDSLGIEYETSNRKLLDGKEIDIYIPSKKVGIEFNGLHWHSNQFVDKNYHKNKTDKARKIGIQLIHVWEDDWKDSIKNAIVKDTIKHILGMSEKQKVYARNCIIRPINANEAKQFLDGNHVQGYYNSTYKYGLTYQDELVGVMTFKKNYDYMELTRFATSVHIVGGFSKMLKAFFRDNPHVKGVISFADRSWSLGGVYKNNGFELIDETKPNYSYNYKGKRIKKQQFRHSRMYRYIDNYDPNLTETENTERNGIYKIYDCGLMKFYKTNPYYEV